MFRRIINFDWSLIDKQETINISKTLEEKIKEFGINMYDNNGKPRTLYNIITDVSRMYWDLNNVDKDKLDKCFNDMLLQNGVMRKDNE